MMTTWLNFETKINQ